MKKNYRKGMELVHKETKQKIFFGKFKEDGSASCISKGNLFLTISREDLDENYVNLKELDRKSREKRRGQGW